MSCHNTEGASETYLSDNMKIPIDNILSETPRLNELLCDTGCHVGGGNSDIINFTCGSDVNNIVDFVLQICMKKTSDVIFQVSLVLHANGLSSDNATVEDLQGSITCGRDFNLNTTIRFRCDTHEGEFTIVDDNNPDDTEQDNIWNRLCQQNTCRAT